MSHTNAGAIRLVAVTPTRARRLASLITAFVARRWPNDTGQSPAQESPLNDACFDANLSASGDKIGENARESFRANIHQTSLTARQGRRTTRRADTLQILDGLSHCTHDWDHQVAVFANGEVRGLLTMRNDFECRIGHVAHLVALPGADRLGRALLEEAVRQSFMWGYAGRLELWSLPGSLAFYLATGFATAAEQPGVIINPLRLNPDASTHWCLDPKSGQRRLTHSRVDATTSSRQR